MDARRRPFGVSSRFIRAEGPRHPWSTGDVAIDLPVIVDWVYVDPDTGEESVRINARVDLVKGTPEIVEMAFTGRTGLDLAALQRDFRWASPLAAVTGILPRIIASGSDPFAVDLPVDGFPAVAMHPLRRRGVLSDEFLTTIAREYLARGRGYAASLADEYFVSPRTAISWVEKARSGEFSADHRVQERPADACWRRRRRIGDLGSHDSRIELGGLMFAVWSAPCR